MPTYSVYKYYSGLVIYEVKADSEDEAREYANNLWDLEALEPQTIDTIIEEEEED